MVRQRVHRLPPTVRRSARARLLATLLAVVAGLVCATQVAAPAAGSPSASRGDGRPNIVFVLTDDLDSSLLQYMPHVQALAQRGTSFSHFIVADSWCCPSRASIFTGEFPHNTGVRNNGDNDQGGFAAFQTHGDEDRTFALRLQDAGYKTAFLGKYLNGYDPTMATAGAGIGYVPKGWNEWYGLGPAYASFDYTANHNGKLETRGDKPADYLNTVLQNHATSFLDASSKQGKPFLMEVATFTPHEPYVPAPQDRGSFTTVRAPRDGAWNTLPTDPPAWLASVRPIEATSATIIDHAAVKRIQAVQSVDRMVASLQQTLQARGQLANTVFVFSSDNGYHLGQHRLRPGKLTAYDTDIRVPLIVAGPGVPAGATTSVLAQNIDLAPTFETLGNTAVPDTVDGRSLVDILHGATPPTWRQRAFVEHQGKPFRDDGDPDAQSPYAGEPTPYEAIRGPDYTYVQYASGEKEYYDEVDDPAELTNLASTLPAARLKQLEAQVAALRTCSGAACWTAATS